MTSNPISPTVLARVKQQPEQIVAMEPIDTWIRELRHAITVASLNYEIWRTYGDPAVRPVYVDTMNRYSLFFQTSIHAHFVALVIALYRLFERRHNSYNIPGLIARLDTVVEAGRRPKIEAAQLLYQELAPVCKRVARLRGTVFAHRSRAHSVEEAFRAAAITPNELALVLEGAKKITNLLSDAFDSSIHAFNLGARADTLKMLEDLRTRRSG